MQVIRDPMRSTDLPRGGVGTIGNFDSVHLGHRRILETVVERAREIGRPSFAITFEPHPMAVLRPDRAPRRVQTLRQKEEAIEAIGIETLLGSVGSGLWRDLAARRVGSLVELLSVGLFTVLTVALFRRGLKPEGVFAGSTLLLLLTSGTLAGVQRYVLVLFPCYFPLAQYLRARPAVALAYGFLGIGGGVVLLHRFVHWYFVG